MTVVDFYWFEITSPGVLGTYSECFRKVYKIAIRDFLVGKHKFGRVVKTRSTSFQLGTSECVFSTHVLFGTL